MSDYKLVSMEPTPEDGLLPCPFCGQPPTEYDGITIITVRCRECKFSIKVKPEDGPPYAAELWNRRSYPQPTDEAAPMKAKQAWLKFQSMLGPADPAAAHRKQGGE